MMSTDNTIGAIAPWRVTLATLGAVVFLIGSSTSLFGAPAEFRLAALAATSGSDISASVPPSQSLFTPGASIYLEVWVQTTDPNGLSSASVDLSFNASLATAVGITPTSLFSELTSGTIDNAGGLIDDLSGSHLGPCTDAVALSPNWARLAVVEFSADVVGEFLMQSATTGSPIYGTAVCGAGDIDPVEIVYGAATIQINEASIPTVSDWGIVAMTLLLITAGTIIYMRRPPLLA